MNHSKRKNLLCFSGQREFLRFFDGSHPISEFHRCHHPHTNGNLSMTKRLKSHSYHLPSHKARTQLKCMRSKCKLISQEQLLRYLRMTSPQDLSRSHRSDSVHQVLYRVIKEFFYGFVLLVVTIVQVLG